MNGGSASIDPAAVLGVGRPEHAPFFRNSSKPYARWWWLVGPFRREDIAFQLDWLAANGFGGVELAWIHPSWMGSRARPELRPAWLGAEWSALLGWTKRYADRIGLGCDFTFGSYWPFGGTCVRPEDAVQTIDGPSDQRLINAWEEPTSGRGPIVSHLSRRALRSYADALAPAFAPGLVGSPSALFCDSLEVDTARMWSADLWERFVERFGYRLEPFADDLDRHPHVRYDYRLLIAETVLREFFEPFTDICHELRAYARVQCHGAPTDLLAAYAAVDVPESETILFDPPFSRIPASAAALASKPVVSAEAFTCIYGFATEDDRRPLGYWRREQVADLKLLADALFANGVNQIVWHGMPYNPPGGTNVFFAPVHVGPDALLASELPAFNRYLETVSAILKLGRTYTNLAVYLPNEDNWVRDRLPEAWRTPAANYYWEMRRVAVPPETEGFHPLWVSQAFLRDAEYDDGMLRVGDARFSALYLDCRWLDFGALQQIARLARSGAPIVLKRRPRQPGATRRPEFRALLDELADLPNVVPDLSRARISPLLEGRDLPPYWARAVGDDIIIFFAHPKARGLRYPMTYGQAYCDRRYQRTVTVHPGSATRRLELVFEPYQSLMVRLSGSGDVSAIDVIYRPPRPMRDRSRG